MSVQYGFVNLPTGGHPEEQADSDSSLTAAANRSLDLSRSLEDKCASMMHSQMGQDEEEVDVDIQPEQVVSAHWMADKLNYIWRAAEACAK